MKLRCDDPLDPGNGASQVTGERCMKCGEYAGTRWFAVFCPYHTAMMVRDSYLTIEDGDDTISPDTFNAINEERRTMAGRGRPKKDPNAVPASGKKATKDDRDLLVQALAFCRPGYKEDGQPFSQHAFISHNFMSTYNGIVQYGHPINDALQCLPHFGKLDAAVKTCGTSLAMTQLSASRLQVKGTGFRVSVPCLEDPADVSRPQPDAGMVRLDNLLRRAFETIRGISAGDRVIQQSVLLESNLITATDMTLMIQFYHGVHLPRLVIPIEFVKAILATQLNILGVGFSERSFTVWFEPPEGIQGNPYMRTQLFSEDWPAIDHIINTDYSRVQAVPENFFETLEKVSQFAEDFGGPEGVVENGRGIIFAPNSMKTSALDDHGAEATVAGLLPCERMIDGFRLSKIKGRFTHADWTTDPAKIVFIGPNFRGVCVNIMDKPKTAPKIEVATGPLPGSYGDTSEPPL